MWLLILGYTLGGCTEVDNPYRPFPEPDFESYVADVQPIVRTQCAFLPCHGSPDRPLTLYAVGFLRAKSSFSGAPLDEHTLTESERAWNYDAMRMRLLDERSADESQLLLKCLDPDEGGIYHGDGVVVFPNRRSPGYRKLAAWIEGAF